MPLMESTKKFVYVLCRSVSPSARLHATKFVMDRGYLPMHENLVPDFYPNIRSEASSKDPMLLRCDEVWVFGDVDRQMDEELSAARRLGKPVRHFQISPGFDIREADLPTPFKDKERGMLRR